MKAKELKNKGVKIKLQDKEYEIKFNMNTFCELEEIYGDITKAFDELGTGKFKAIRALLYAALKNEDDSLTIKRVGEMLDVDNMQQVSDAIGKALDIAMPNADGDLAGE